MAKKKGNAGFILVALLLVAGAYLYVNLGGLITRTAEKIASDALGVKVNIGSIAVSLSEKKATVYALKIGNPPGYNTPYAMTAEKIRIGLNTASKELVDFKDISVEGSVVNLEVNERGSNLTDLKRLAAGKPQRESVGSKQVRVIVQHMVIGASTLNPTITLLGRKIAPVKLPAITISSMGKGGGMEAGDAIVQILSRYISMAQIEAQKAGMMQGLPTDLDGVGKAVEGVTGGLKGLFK